MARTNINLHFDGNCEVAFCLYREVFQTEFTNILRYSDIPRQLLEYSNDSNMLKAISDYAKAADVGIEDMKFEINSKEINEEADLPANIPEEVKAALVQFMHVLSETSNNSETHLKMGQVNATSMHQGRNYETSSLAGRFPRGEKERAKWA